MPGRSGLISRTPAAPAAAAKDAETIRQPPPPCRNTTGAPSGAPYSA